MCRRICPAILWLGSLAHAQQAEYFPLQQGNIWVYRCAGACGADSAVIVEVGPSQIVNGATYWQLRGWFGGDYLVREDSDSVLWAYDAATKQERIWYAFQTAEGETYDESIPSNCCGRATVQSRSAMYEGPVGSFQTGLSIAYPGATIASVASELFLPWVGLLTRSLVSDPAAHVYDLIYARLGGVLVVTPPEISVSLALDQPVYPMSGNLTARLGVRNSTTQPERLTFPTGQVYDLEIRDGDGNVVFLWSRDRSFTQAIQTVQIQYEKDYVITAPLAGLKPGRYVGQAWLTVEGPARAYSASARFEIR